MSHGYGSILFTSLGKEETRCVSPELVRGGGFPNLLFCRHLPIHASAQSRKRKGPGGSHFRLTASSSKWPCLTLHVRGTAYPAAETDLNLQLQSLWLWLQKPCRHDQEHHSARPCCPLPEAYLLHPILRIGTKECCTIYFFCAALSCSSHWSFQGNQLWTNVENRCQLQNMI